MPTWSDIPAVRLGLLAGIPIKLDLTFLFAALTVLFSLLRRQFPSTWDYVIAFVLVLGGVFLSILTHELGHALVARRYGLRADEIRIGGFYGLAFLSGTPARRIEGILILLAGPLANAANFAALWFALGMPTLTSHFYLSDPVFATAIMDHAALRVSVQWLAYVNLGMLIFNLLPAFPLDGGRIARLLLGRYVDDGRAVRWVASLGVFIGAWSCFGIFAYPALLFVGPFLVLANYAIRRGELAAPVD